MTLLHVYHHASISFIWWMITNTAPGGDAYFSAAINSSVHVIMYLYYLLAILLGKDNKARAPAQPAAAPAPGGLTRVACAEPRQVPLVGSLCDADPDDAVRREPGAGA